MEIAQIPGKNRFGVDLFSALQNQRVIYRTTSNTAVCGMCDNRLILPASQFHQIQTPAYFLNKRQCVFGGYPVAYGKAREYCIDFSQRMWRNSRS